MKSIVNTESVMRPVLTHALLVYEDNDSAFVTMHGVDIKNARPTIGPGAPVSRSALAGLAAKLQNATALSGFLPAELLYLSPRAIAWWRPARPAPMFFESPKIPALGKRNGITPQPPLVFAVNATDWYVWALEADARPTDATLLRIAPYFNVWKGGKICTGNVKLPDALRPDVLADYEAAFFGSSFTHPNQKAITRYPGGAGALWTDLLKRKRKTFPMDSLRKTKQTLADAIKTLEKNTHDD